MILDAEELSKKIREQYVAALPEHLQRLGEILRETVVAGDLGPFAQFLSEQEIAAPQDQLAVLRDLLIISRLDLKDLEPAARERLRAHTLATEDHAEMSPDYKAAIDAGEMPKCRGCRYFVHAPNDGSPDGDKSCVSLGTKGADAACRGYTKQF